MSEGIEDAIRHANARIADWKAQLLRECQATGGCCGPTQAEEDPEDLALLLFGIKQVAIDPRGFLRMRRHADETEIRRTAKLYAFVKKDYLHWVSGLIDISVELMTHEGWPAFAEGHVNSVLMKHPDMDPEYLSWCFAHSYVLGMFAPEYPESLLQKYPSTAREYRALQHESDPGQTRVVLASQMALNDLLMVPNQEGMDDRIQMN